MIREAKEEVNIIVKEENLKLVHVSNNLVSDPERIDFFFPCETWTGDVTINEPDKCDDIRWIAIDEIPDNTTATVKIALSSIHKGKNYSEYRGE